MQQQQSIECFKNLEWIERKKELRSDRGRIKKNIKQIISGDALSNREYTYLSIDAPPSMKPGKTYCDITGFESKYRDLATTLVFCDRTVGSYVKMLPRPTAEQFLGIRKPVPEKPLV